MELTEQEDHLASPNPVSPDQVQPSDGAKEDTEEESVEDMDEQEPSELLYEITSSKYGSERAWNYVENVKGLDGPTPNCMKLRSTIKRTYVYRYDLKFKTAASTEPDEELTNALKEWFTTMKRAESNLVLLPYFAENQDMAYIVNPQRIPSMMSQLKKYFQGVFARHKGGEHFVGVVLAHNRDMKEIMEDVSSKLMEEGTGLWRRNLQHESLEEAGWLLYSSRDMSPAIMGAVLSYITQCTVGVRWRVIKTGKKRAPDEPFDRVNAQRALHLEVPTADAPKAIPMLQSLYKSGQTIFPLGIRLRLIPPIKGMMNHHTITKIEHLAQRQHAFTTNISGAPTWELVQIDKVDYDLAITLREALKSIMSEEFPHLTVFHSIFPGFRSFLLASSPNWQRKHMP